MRHYASAGLEVFRIQGTWCSGSVSTAKQFLSQPHPSRLTPHHSLDGEVACQSAGTSPAGALALALFRGVDSNVTTTVLPRHKGVN